MSFWSIVRFWREWTAWTRPELFGRHSRKQFSFLSQGQKNMYLRQFLKYVIPCYLIYRQNGRFDLLSGTKRGLLRNKKAPKKEGGFYYRQLSKVSQCGNCKQILCQRLLKLLASNASLRKRCLPGRNFVPVIPACCLLVICPQTPKIIAAGNGCAFRWNAEKSKVNILPK